MSISRLSQIVLYLLLAISLFFIGAFFFGGYVPGTEGTNAAEPLITNRILTWAFILFIIAAAASILFPLVYNILNPKNILRTVIVLVVIAGLLLLSYSLASDEVLNMVGYNGPDNVPRTLKRADTGLIMTYILAGFAIVSIIFTEISKLFK